MKKPTIAVIGHKGMVGSAVYNWFKKQKYPVMGLSLKSKTHTWDQINKKADYIFVAVPTPYNWKEKEADLNILIDVLGKIDDGKVVIHKCTVPPGTTKIMQFEFPTLHLLYNPEFLSEKTRERDFNAPDRQLIGYTKESYKHSMAVLNLLPESAYGQIMPATEAEICKFINNFHGAMMVIFANFFYDVVQALMTQTFEEKLDFERIKQAAWASKWVGSPMGRMYWNVFQDGFRGYGNACLPKDVNMLIKWCEDFDVPCEILKATREANRRILADQDLTEERVEKK